MVKSIKIRTLDILLLVTIVFFSQLTVAEGLVDPTLSPFDAPVATGDQGVIEGDIDLVLQSVMLSSGRKVALINGKTFSVGDKVGSARLIAVTDHSATLRNSDKTLKILNMHPDVVKKVSINKKQAASAKNMTKHAEKIIGQTK